MTRSDLAGPERTEATLADARARIGRTTLGAVAAVACSARTGAGLAEVRAALARLVASLPRPEETGRVRLWLDRSFAIKGAGTVVTGTLVAGSLAVGDTLELAGMDRDRDRDRDTDTDTGWARAGRTVRVRGLQSLERPQERMVPTARVAVNLRGVEAALVRRGDVLLTPGAWRLTRTVDVRLTRPAADLPQRLTLHVGTAAVPVRVRPLVGPAARLTLPRALPLATGDRALLRDPGASGRLGPGAPDTPDAAADAVTGVLVVDADPPEIRRRGAPGQRGAVVAASDGRLDLVTEVDRRGHLAVSDAVELGLPDLAEPPDALRRVADRYVTKDTWSGWAEELRAAVAARAAADPLDPRLPYEAARAAVRLPDLRLVAPLAQAAGLVSADGRVAAPDQAPDLGAAETGLARIEARLAADPFAAPEADELAAAGLGPKELAAAARAGRVLRLPGEVILLPIAAAQAMRVLSRLDQPFTLSQARVALGTTRRVAVPLLEHLDSRGWTRRVDGQRREVVRL